MCSGHRRRRARRHPHRDRLRGRPRNPGARRARRGGHRGARRLDAVLRAIRPPATGLSRCGSPPAVTTRVAIEQASSLGWHRYVATARDRRDAHFGASAPLKELSAKGSLYARRRHRRRAQGCRSMTPLRERAAWRALERHHARFVTSTCAISSPRMRRAATGSSPRAPGSTSTTRRTALPTRRCASCSAGPRSRACPSGRRRCPG